MSKTEERRFRPMNVMLRTGSRAESAFRRIAALPGGVERLPAAIAGGVSPHPEEDLLFHGGRTIQNLIYTNFYIGGSASWSGTDRQNIDAALAKAMTDPNLSNVIRQYFDNKPITTTFRPSKIVAGGKPPVFSQGDVEALVRKLRRNGALKGFDLPNTVFNFILPRGTILNSDQAKSSAKTGPRITIRNAAADVNPVRPEDEASSLEGLGGYHGSVHVLNPKATIYYSIAVFSEGNNGIVAFDQPWKNVVATLVHELQEARTDPDVEDAIKAGNSPTGARFLGWVSNSGNEIGDFPMSETGGDLGLVMKEVPLADGSGTVPVQLMYSNFADGPEGPIPAVHPPANRNFQEKVSLPAALSRRNVVRR